MKLLRNICDFISKLNCDPMGDIKKAGFWASIVLILAEIITSVIFWITSHPVLTIIIVVICVATFLFLLITGIKERNMSEYQRYQKIQKRKK